MSNKPASDSPQKHFRWTMSGPVSSYSSLVIHICCITEREPRIEAPSHAACFRSAGAVTRTSVPPGARRARSCCSRESKPSKHEVPPATTTLENHAEVPSRPIVFDSSTPSRSRNLMQSATIWEIPPAASSMSIGLKRGSAIAARCSADNCSVRPSGSVNCFSPSIAVSAVFLTKPRSSLSLHATAGSSEQPAAACTVLAVHESSASPATVLRSCVRGSGRPSWTKTA
mmetsp:Transcript_36916/g.61175  ORF Transcript_36916/g.61175 Transcript_36916/m.61175 type:complete len:228 (-) Transcript_36916:455-1138(-)